VYLFSGEGGREVEMALVFCCCGGKNGIREMTEENKEGGGLWA
jgi:hypothetical protein